MTVLMTTGLQISCGTEVKWFWTYLPETIAPLQNDRDDMVDCLKVGSTQRIVDLFTPRLAVQGQIMA